MEEAPIIKCCSEHIASRVHEIAQMVDIGTVDKIRETFTTKLIEIIILARSMCPCSNCSVMAQQVRDYSIQSDDAVMNHMKNVLKV